MFAAVAHVLTLLVATAVFVGADPNPSSPGPGDVFIEGKPCTISWDVDLTGLWKPMNIELMTGNNFDMVSLTPVATVDGTNPSKNTYSWTCPQVSPHSPVYFYQFTSVSTGNKTWTGRFAITGPTLDLASPSQSTQPNGESIPWGTGTLVSGPSAPGGAPSAANGSTLGTNSGSTSASASGGSPSSTFTTSSFAYHTAHTSATPKPVMGANGAVAARYVPVSSGGLLQAAVALGVAAVGFAAMV